MRLIYFIVIEFLFAILFFSCEPHVTEPVNTSPQSVATLPLDNNSVVLSSFSIQGSSGSMLAIDEGTAIFELDTSGVYLPIPAGNAVGLSLAEWNFGSATAPQGEKIVAGFQISATINGTAAALLFSCPADSSIPGRPGTGVHWTAQISNITIDAGSRITLYKVSGTGDLELISSQVVGIPILILAKTHDGGNASTTVGPNGTGQYVITTASPSPSASSAFPSGVYWTIFSSIPSNPYVLGGQTYGDSLFIGYVEIGEMSTSEIMAGLGFPHNSNCVTYTNPNDHAQYWVERTQAPSGVTTAIKVGATVANIPYLNLQLYSIRDGKIELSANGLRPDGGVHTPEGTVLTDPYQQSSLKFGGIKILSFVIKNYRQGTEIKEKVEAAGYECSSIRFKESIYSFDVVETLDARKLMEENVLQQNKWYPDPQGTKGNVGLYTQNIIIDITSHANNETVNNSKVTLRGTISTLSVTDMLVTYSSLRDLQTKEAHATIEEEEDGESFSVDLDLTAGINTITFAPIGKDDQGAEEYLPKFTLKAKGTTIDGLVLTYNASWTGRLVVSWVSTSETKNSITKELESRSVVTNSISTNLNFDFESSKIGYIQASHTNAVTCAGFDDCEIFYGTSQGLSPSLSEQWENHTLNCAGELPLMEASHGSGQASLPNYRVTVAAVLTPWEANSSDTTRHYHLRVQGWPDWTINTDPTWPQNSGEYYDCYDSIWVSTHSKIGFQIDLNKDDNPPVLQFNNTADLENYVKTPSGAKTWNFQGMKEYSDDYGSTVTQYTATLMIQAN